jgi:hypothetical protein
MPATIQITTDNYNGQTAIITFTPDNGGPVVNLGSQVLPYDYNSDYYYGTYSLYFPSFDTTCTLVIAGQTPTPTPTITPTITPTMTPTPSPTQPKQYYVYRLCNSTPPQYVVQTLPGLTITPGKVLRSPLDYGFPIGIAWFCWEFLYVTNTSPSFPPGTNVINFTGNYFSSVLNIVFDKCSDCLAYVEPPPPQAYNLVGPYGSSSQACAAGNAAGGALGTATFTNGITIGSQVYNTPLFGTTQLVTTPGWYAASPSFLSIYSSFRIDNTGTIVEVGSLLCF